MSAAQKKVTQMNQMRCQLNYFHCQVWNCLSAEEYKKWCENMSAAQKKVAQMLRCTADLTIFTARIEMVSLLRNIRRPVKQGPMDCQKHGN